MGIAVVERNALLEQVWDLWKRQDYPAIVELLVDLPSEEHLGEPEFGIALCNAWHHLGELQKSLILIQQLAPGCERRGNSRISRRRINLEALIRLARGELNEAEWLLGEVLDRTEATDDIQLRAWVYNNSGILHTMRRNWDFALSHFRRAIVAGQRIGDVQHIAMCHMNMGYTYRIIGQLNQAREHLVSAAELSGEAGNQAGIGHIEYHQALLHIDEEDLILARISADQARRKFDALNSDKGKAMFLEVMGRIQMKEGRYTEAYASFQEALRLVRAMFVRGSEADFLEQLGIVARIKGNADAYIDFTLQAIKVFQEIGNQAEVIRLQNSLRAPINPGPAGEG